MVHPLLTPHKIFEPVRCLAGMTVEPAGPLTAQAGVRGPCTSQQLGHVSIGHTQRSSGGGGGRLRKDGKAEPSACNFLGLVFPMLTSVHLSDRPLQCIRSPCNWPFLWTRYCLSGREASI